MDAPDDDLPTWAHELAARAGQVIPFYRRLGVASWADVPLIERSDLARDIAAFVPTDVDLDRVVQGTSSGSSGSSLAIPWHPVDIAKDLPLLAYLLGHADVDWAPDPARMGLLSVVDQQQAFTYASAMSLRDGQPMARINLHAAAWQAPEDLEKFVESQRPQVVTGSSLALLRYAELDVPAPLAIVSGALTLTATARARLTERFGVPVLDLYGLRETGPIAVSYNGIEHHLVPRRIWVETVDGEIVVTAAENPYLPLLRYRTGDHGAVAHGVLTGLEGRAPVRFRHGDGTWLGSVDLTQQLQHHGALMWQVHQHTSGAVDAEILGGDPHGAQAALSLLLDVPVTVVGVSHLGPGKPRRFSSDIDLG